LSDAAVEEGPGRNEHRPDPCLGQAREDRIGGCKLTAEALHSELTSRGGRRPIVYGGEPLLHRYHLYKRVKAALALPPGPERVAALQATKIDDRRKH